MADDYIFDVSRNANPTAAMSSKNATKWFQCKHSPLKNSVTKSVNTLSVITSWMIFSCISENGPPLSTNPMRLAGTIKQYSSSAMPHDTKITTTSGQWVEMPAVWSLRCPYQAKVIKVLEIINSAMVISAALKPVIMKIVCVEKLKYKRLNLQPSFVLRLQIYTFFSNRASIPPLCLTCPNLQV